MSVNEIRGWLLQHPRAHSLRVVTTDDRHHEVAVHNGVSWMAVAQSVHALQPLIIEAYDPKGHVLRAVRPEELDEDDERPSGPRAPQPLVMPPNMDPQSAMMVHFADLLAAAYRHSTDVAFERLCNLFEASNQRIESLERSLETMTRLVQRAQQEVDAAEASGQPQGGDLLSQMVQGFTAAAHSNGAGSVLPPTNGKAES